MTLTSKPLAGLVVIFLLGGIFFSSATGWWQTESTKVAAKITTGEFAGQANPADIRGSYTFGDVEKNFQISASVMAQAFGITTTTPATINVKELEALYAGSAQEVGTGSVRLFVALYKGMPYDLSTDTYLPASAVAVLQTRNLTGEQKAYLTAHTVSNSGTALATSAPGAAPQGTSAPTGAATPKSATPSATSTDRTIKGSTTFADVSGWGVSKTAIEKALGTTMPTDLTIKIKDYCTEKTLDFETIKTTLQTLIDQVK
jgi:hypothetical protein